MGHHARGRGPGPAGPSGAPRPGTGPRAGRKPLVTDSAGAPPGHGPSAGRSGPGRSTGGPSAFFLGQDGENEQRPGDGAIPGAELLEKELEPVRRGPAPFISFSILRERRANIMETNRSETPDTPKSERGSRQ